MRILISPQEFKGSLTARQAAAAIAEGLARSQARVELDSLPLADGGPGTVEALVAGSGGQTFEADVHDPLGRPVRAVWGALGGQAAGRTAVTEMAAASGLVLLDDAERDPTVASTVGTGELILAALDAGYHEIIVGAGGSATNDGGAGMAQALGARLLDGDGLELPPGGGALERLARIDVAGLDSRLKDTSIVVATDVKNPLCGPTGASLVYGAQKGASKAAALRLDRALRRYAEIVRRDLGIEIASVAGGGAAGGLAAGLIAFCGAELRSGFDVVAEAVGLERRMAGADAVVTGEGRLDRQSGFGKTTAGVARMARAGGKRVVAVVGSVTGNATEAFDAVFAVVPELAAETEAMGRASELVATAAEQAGRWLAKETADSGC